MSNDKPNPNIIAGIRGHAPLEIGGQTIIIKCKWCGNPATDVKEEECGICHELKMLLAKRPQAGVRMIGQHTNVAQHIINIVAGTQILPNGFPPGLYEKWDLSTEEKALEVFKQFAEDIKSNMSGYLLTALADTGLIKLPPPEQERLKIALGDPPKTDGG